MADETNISWCDSTFNPWWGCTKIAPGCDNCYAAALDKRTGGNYWDIKQVPRRTRPANWRKPIRWNEQAGIYFRRHRVFCGSMMDWCDKDSPPGAVTELFELIKQTPRLDWQLLTKRATLIQTRLPADWGDGYGNVWLGVTVENREYGYPRIDALRNVPAAIRFLSVEPMLERMPDIDLTGIDWVICGGESGPGFRQFDPEWGQELAEICETAGVAYWFKQHGGQIADKSGCLLDGKEFKQWPVPT